MLTKEEETGLEEYILTCSQMFHGLGYKAVRRLSFEYAQRKGKTYPISWEENAMAGKEWMLGFMKRHQRISLRSPEATSMSRAIGFNERSVASFFDLWVKTQAEQKFNPDMIFNLDETGITTVQNIPMVLATKGLKQVGQISAAERGTLVTVCCCVNAVGKSLPPVMIFPRVHFKDHMISGGPPGTLGLATQSGWMNSELFPRVLDHFIKHMSCSVQNPAVLFMDNHESHLGLEVIEMARKNGLSIITFPPHTSHKLQPLDVAVYGPLKCHYKKAVDEWNLTHPGKRITIYDLPECFSRAFYRALSFQNIVSGFRKTGIWPVNFETFTADDFLAVSVFSSNTTAELRTGAEVDMTFSTEIEIQPQATSATSNSSFQELVEIRPLPKRKANVQLKLHSKRKAVGCKLITSTPEKEAAEEKIQKKNQKKPRPKKKLIPKTIPINLNPSLNDKDDTSSSDELSFHSDSSDFEEDFSELEGHSEITEPAEKEPEVDDFVLVKLTPVNSKNAVHYVAQIVDVSTDDEGTAYHVEFYRQSRKMPSRFTKPLVEDCDKINRDEIVMCLPKPSTTGGTKRVASMMQF